MQAASRWKEWLEDTCAAVFTVQAVSHERSYTLIGSFLFVVVANSMLAFVYIQVGTPKIRACFKCLLPALFLISCWFSEAVFISTP